MTPEQQARLDVVIVNYIIAEARPLITVESPSFRDLIQGTSCNLKAQVMCRKTLTVRIAKEFILFQKELKDEFDSVLRICLTADIWSARHRGFMGVTAHWIVKSAGGLQRRSAAIALKRFEGNSFSFILLLLLESDTNLIVFIYIFFYRFTYVRQNSFIAVKYHERL